MRLFNWLPALAAAAALIGCATSPGSMREDQAAKRSAVLDLPYQLVLKRIVDQYAECTPAPILPIGTMINDVHHYPDLKTASITRGAEGIGRQIHQVIDIAASPTGGTQLTVFSKMATDGWFSKIKGWAQGGTGC